MPGKARGRGQTPPLAAIREPPLGPGESAPAAPASSRPLHSALFRAPGAINRGSRSPAAALRSGPPTPRARGPAAIARPRVTAAKFRGGMMGRPPGPRARRPPRPRFQSFRPRGSLRSPPAPSRWGGVSGGGAPILHPRRTPAWRRANSKSGSGEGFGGAAGVAAKSALGTFVRRTRASGRLELSTLRAGKTRMQGPKAHFANRAQKSNLQKNAEPRATLPPPRPPPASNRLRVTLTARGGVLAAFLRN